MTTLMAVKLTIAILGMVVGLGLLLYQYLNNNTQYYTHKTERLGILYTIFALGMFFSSIIYIFTR